MSYGEPYAKSLLDRGEKIHYYLTSVHGPVQKPTYFVRTVFLSTENLVQILHTCGPDRLCTIVHKNIFHVSIFLSVSVSSESSNIFRII